MIRENIVKLIESNVSTTQVSKETKIPLTTCHRIFTGEASLDNVTLKNAEKLNEYYQKVILQEQHL